MEQVKSFLKKLEADKGIRIVFALESGSREWGMASKDSDFDVRGVFCYPPQRYYDLLPYAEDLNIIKGDIDVHLMELRKFMRLLLNSNPTCIEWIQSKTWYVGNRHEVFDRFLKNDWSPKALAHHYVGLCKQNYLKYLKTRKEPTVKRYLYACRGWLAGMIALKGKLPPINVVELVEKAPIKEVQRRKLRALLKAKKSGSEHMLAGELPEFDEWLADFINNAIPPTAKKVVNIKPYRDFVIQTIQKE